MTELFINDILQGKRTNNELTNLLKRPINDNAINAPRFDYYPPNIYHQADLLELPNDKGYEYSLVVSDVGARVVDAYPLKSKTAAEVVKAFKILYEHHDILKYPLFLTVDNGSEFKGEVAAFCRNHDISLKRNRVGRHRQLGVVERKNQTIGKIIHQLIHKDELETNQKSSQWVKYLPLIIKSINKIVTSKVKPYQSIANNKVAPRVSGNSSKLLSVNDRVRVVLDEPYGHGTKFRSGDIRWDKQTHDIEYVLLKPNQPPMYMVDGIDNVAYTKNQLQVVTPNEQKINKLNVAGNRRHEIETILGHKIVKKHIEFLVKWKDLPKTQASFEPRSSLIGDIKRLILNYESKHDMSVNNLPQSSKIIVLQKDRKLKSGEFIVEKILGHIGSTDNLKKMKFTVKWLGYDAPTVEPYNNLKNNVVLHDYLESL